MSRRCTAISSSSKKGQRCGLAARSGALTCEQAGHASQHLTETDWVSVALLPATASQCLASGKSGARCQQNAVAGSNHCPIKSHGEQLRSPAYCILRSNLSGGVLDTLETTAAASLLDPHASIVGLTFGTLPSKDILEPRFDSLCGLNAQRQANTR